MWSGEEQAAIRRGTEMPRSQQRPADQQTCVSSCYEMSYAPSCYPPNVTVGNAALKEVIKGRKVIGEGS